MKNTFLLFLCIILGVVWPAHVGAAAARPLRVAYLSTSATMASLWMAKETGAIAKEGIDVEVLSMNASLAIPALIAGELDAIRNIRSAGPHRFAARIRCGFRRRSTQHHDLEFLCQAGNHKR